MNFLLSGGGQSGKAGPNAKPTHASAATNPNSRYQTFLFMATMLVSAALFTVAISGRRHALLRRQRDKDLRNIYGGDNGDGGATCHNAQKLEVCSHQLLNAPPTGLLGLAGPPVDGSVQAMASLWKSGIRCFDVGVVTLQDSTLLASHPSRFAQAVGPDGDKPEEYTLGRARVAGAGEVGFPTLMDVLEGYASLVKGEGSFYVANSSESGEKDMMIPPLVGPLLSVHLKGPNLTADHLTAIKDSVKGLELSDKVAIYASPVEDDEVGPGINLLKSSPSGIALILLVRDKVEKDGNLERIKALTQSHRAIRLIAPSNKFKVDWFQGISGLGLPVKSWTVDDEPGLLRAIRSGVSAIVGNDPIALREILRNIRRICR